MSQVYIGVPVSSLPTVPTSFVTDSGTVIPAANVVNVNGGPGIEVIANPTGSNNMVIVLTDVAAHYTNVTASMSPYTVTATDYFISCDSTTGAITLLFPNTTTQSREFVVKDRTGDALTNHITLTTVGGVVLLDGMTTYVFDEEYESVEMLFNGTSYELF